MFESFINSDDQHERNQCRNQKQKPYVNRDALASSIEPSEWQKLCNTTTLLQMMNYIEQQQRLLQKLSAQLTALHSESSLKQKAYLQTIKYLNGQLQTSKTEFEKYCELSNQRAERLQKEVVRYREKVKDQDHRMEILKAGHKEQIKDIDQIDEGPDFGGSNKKGTAESQSGRKVPEMAMSSPNKNKIESETQPQKSRRGTGFSNFLGFGSKNEEKKAK